MSLASYTASQRGLPHTRTVRVRGFAVPGSRADDAVEDPAHEEPGGGAQTPVEERVLGVGVGAGELLDAVVREKIPRSTRSAPSSTNFTRSLSGWRRARRGAHPTARNIAATRNSSQSTCERTVRTWVTVLAPRPGCPTCRRPGHRCRSWCRCRVRTSRSSVWLARRAGCVSALRRWPCPAPARRRIAYRSCGRRWRTGPRTPPARSPARCRGRPRGRGRPTPSPPAARGRRRRRTAPPRRPPRRRPGSASLGTTRSTSPIASASSALTNRPVKMSSLARLGPISRLSRWVPPGAGDDPEQHLGLPELGVLGGEPDVGRQRQLAPAAERVAGDRGDDRLGDPRHRGHRGLHRAPRARPCRRSDSVGHLLDVVAGREDPLPAVEDDRPHVVALGRLGGGVAQLGLHLEADRVHLRPVEPDGADAVGDLEADELCGELTHGPHHAVRASA